MINEFTPATTGMVMRQEFNVVQTGVTATPLTVSVWTVIGAVPLSVTRLRLVLKLAGPATVKLATLVPSQFISTPRRLAIQLLMADGLLSATPLAWKAAYFASSSASIFVPAPVWKYVFTPSASAYQYRRVQAAVWGTMRVTTGSLASKSGLSIGSAKTPSPTSKSQQNSFQPLRSGL